MGITGSHTKLTQLFCQAVDQLIVFYQLLMGKTPFPFQKRIITQGLYLQVIIKIRYFQ